MGFTICNIGKCGSFLITSLRRKNQSTVCQCNPLSGSRSKQPPFRAFSLTCYIIRKTPCQSVVRTFSYQKLTGFFQTDSRLRSFLPPLVYPVSTIFIQALYPLAIVIQCTMHPQSGYINVICIFIHKDTSITHSFKLLRQTSPFSHIQYRLNGLPRQSFIKATMKSDIYVPLQITSQIITGIKYSQQRSVVTGSQSRNT